MSGVEQTAVLRPATAKEVAAAFVVAARGVGIEPTRALIVTLLAQSALETGHWTVMWNYNFGNVKATDTWIADGGDYVFYPAREDGKANVSENLNVKWFTHVMMNAQPRTDGGTWQGSNLDAYNAGKRKDGRWAVYFYPSNVQARFRAFDTLADGAAAYLAKLTGKYAGALEAAQGGDVEGYVRKLHELGPYFTADVAAYTRTVASLFNRYKDTAFELEEDGVIHMPPLVVVASAPMKGSEWFDTHLKHLGQDRAAVMEAAKHAVEQGWDVDWPMQPVEVAGVTFFAASDYFAVGCPTDYVYVPLDGETAQWIANRKGCMLPTRQMVQHIWAAADTRINASLMPMTPSQGYPYSNDMFDVRRLPVHTQKVLDEVGDSHDVTRIMAGHKKDVVVSNRLLEKTLGQWVAIYGWQRTDGSPIQGPGVSIKHVGTYWDYSHGIRFISRVGKVHGMDVPLTEVLQDPVHHKAVSDEGPLRVVAYPVHDDEELAPDTEPSPPSHSTVELYAEISRGSKGASVKKWQEYLIWRGHDLAPWGADSDFGRVTTAATAAEQRANLDEDQYVPGVVGQPTWGLYREPPPVYLPTIVLDDTGLPPIEFVQAANYTRVERPAVKWVVLHTMEAAEHPGTAENVAAWFGGPSAPQASAHYNVDGDSIVQSVKEEHVAWHAKKGNKHGIGIEHAGYAKQVDEGWHDAYSSAMLVLSAKLTARICRRWGIPAVFVDEAGLQAGERGFTYHATVTKAFKVYGGHMDPGNHFPIDEYLGMVQAELDRLEAA